MIKEFLKDQGQRCSWSFPLAAMYPGNFRQQDMRRELLHMMVK